MEQPCYNTGRRTASSHCRWGLCLFLTACIATADSDTPHEEQLRSLDRGISKLEQWLKSAQTKKSGLQTELQRSEKKIGKVARQIRSVAKDIKETQQRLATLNARHDQLLLDRVRQEKLLARQIRASYYLGNQGYIKVLLNQEQPERLARALKYYDYFNRARTQQIEAHNTILKQLRLSQLAVETETKTLKQANKVLLSKQQKWGEQRKKRSAILAHLESDIENRDTQLTGLLRNREQLEQLIRAVEENIPEFDLSKDTQPIKQLKGQLPWPTKGKILHRYGTTDRQTGTRWQGLMISANQGQDVRAVHHGHVVFADWLRGYGLLIIIDHGNGYMSLYGHNQALYRESGDWVNVGEVIAGVGDSGGLQQANLYFEIRRDGKTENPQKWIVAAK